MATALFSSIRREPGAPPALLLLALAMLIGGGGTRFPIYEGLVEAGGVLCLAWTLARRGIAGMREDRTALILLGLIVLLPVLQLIPLPPAMWGALPGRAPAVQAEALAGIAPHWFPLSVDPAATWRCVLTLLPAIAMFVAVLRLSPRAWIWLYRLLIGIAIGSAFLGALQFGSKGAPALFLFPTPHNLNPVGLFVNRNHQATLMLIAIIATAAVMRLRDARQSRTGGTILGIGLIALFAVTTIATTSRMGATLLPVALGSAVLLLKPANYRIDWRYALGAIVVIGAIVAVALQNDVVAATFGRFSDADIRSDIWRDTWWAIRQYFPFGSGFGTFRQSFAAAQTLSTVGPNYVNHAHQEYLEVLLEGGLAGALLVLLFLGYLGRIAMILWAAPAHSPWRLFGGSALAGMAIVLLHALVDYPIRMLSIETIFAFLAAIAVASARRSRREGEIAVI